MPNAFDKRAIPAAVALVLLAPLGAANALEAKISGQVNRAIMLADDGDESQTYFVDNDNSSTRFRFTGSEEINSDLTAGIVWEVEYQSNASNVVSITSKSDNPVLGERKMEAYLKGHFGTVWLGQGDGAANGNIEQDLSGTSVINYAGNTDIGGGFAFTDGTNVGPTIGQSLSQLDFESRYDRLRYDTPKLGPVVISVSTGVKGNNDVNELGAKLSTDLGDGGKIAAALGYSVEDKATLTSNPDGDETTVGGSISWLAPSGFNITAAVSMIEDDDTKDASYQYIKVGYKTGMHAVAIDYGQGDDQAADGDEATTFGIGYVYTPAKWAELYAGYEVNSFDRSGTDFDDITILTGGTRIKF